MANLQIKDLIPGKTYNVQVRSTNANGELSEWSSTYTFQAPADTSATLSSIYQSQIGAGSSEDSGILKSVTFNGPLNSDFSIKTISGKIDSSQYSDKTGWAIDYAGNAIFSNAYIRGTLDAGGVIIGKNAVSTFPGLKIDDTNYWYLNGSNQGVFALGGSNGITYDGSTVVIGDDVTILGGLTTTALTVGTSPDQVKISNNVEGTNDGIYITKTGDYWYSNASFRLGGSNGISYTGSGNIAIGTGATFAGSLSAASGTFAGVLSAATGTFAGALSAATGTFNGTVKIGQGSSQFTADTEGIYLGNASFSAAPFSVSPGGYLKSVSGVIGGFSIASGSLTAGTGSTAVGLNSSGYPFYAGNSNPSSAPFYVTSAGLLHATNASISGEINATSGSFTGQVGISTGGSLVAGNATDGVIVNSSGLYGYDNGLQIFSIPTAAGSTPSLANFKVVDTAIYSDNQNANLIIGDFATNNITIRGQYDQGAGILPAIYTTISGSATTGSAGEGFYLGRDGKFRLQNTNVISRTASGESGQRIITVDNAEGIVSGMSVSGTGIGSNAKVLYILDKDIYLSVENASTITSQTATFTGINIISAISGNLTVTGNIHATSGYIGGTTSGWKIESEKITNNLIGLIAPSEIFRYNFIKNPSFEGGTVGTRYWYTTIDGNKIDTSVGYDPTGTPLIEPGLYAGEYYMKVVAPTGSQSSQLITKFTGVRYPNNSTGTLNSRIFVSENNVYTFSVYIKTPAGLSVNANVGIDWYNDQGTYGTMISSSESALEGTTVGEWKRYYVTATAPLTSASAVPYVRIKNLEAGDIHYIDTALFEKSSVVNMYFDGDLRGGMTRWLGESQESASIFSEYAFYSGTDYLSRESASFGVTHDGYMYAVGGKIGSWDISTNAFIHDTSAGTYTNYIELSSTDTVQGKSKISVVSWNPQVNYNISSASMPSPGIIKYYTLEEPEIKEDDIITISGFNIEGYNNSTVEVLTVNNDENFFTIASSQTSIETERSSYSITEVQPNTPSLYQAKYLSPGHKFKVGDRVTVAGASISGYNGPQDIISIETDAFIVSNMTTGTPVLSNATATRSGMKALLVDSARLDASYASDHTAFYADVEGAVSIGSALSFDKEAGLSVTGEVQGTRGYIGGEDGWKYDVGGKFFTGSGTGFMALQSQSSPYYGGVSKLIPSTVIIDDQYQEYGAMYSNMYLEVSTPVSVVSPSGATTTFNDLSSLLSKAISIYDTDTSSSNNLRFFNSKSLNVQAIYDSRAFFYQRGATSLVSGVTYSAGSNTIQFQGVWVA